MANTHSKNSYVGRFAPSPTGDLHFGSLLAAAASYLQAKKSRGRWLVRIEDIDPPREVPGSSANILRTLERFGMVPDGPVLYQSQRTDAYRDCVEKLVLQGKAYFCACSRRDLPPSGIYPGTCRGGLPKGKVGRAIRLRVDGAFIRFTDRIQGDIEENLESDTGDFVIQRADGLPAYQLAVVLDDAYQGVTEIVRGADLLDSTARQIHLQQSLNLTTPSYAHHPIAMDREGHKLSKRYDSDPVNELAVLETIKLVLNFLGQETSDLIALDRMWQDAIANWKLSSVPRAAQFAERI
jgi:glutamyl-Q tRNA(Asp) synthetase